VSTDGGKTWEVPVGGLMGGGFSLHKKGLTTEGHEVLKEVLKAKPRKARDLKIEKTPTKRRLIRIELAARIGRLRPSGEEKWKQGGGFDYFRPNNR